MDKQKLIDCVKELFDRAEMYDAFASITSNDIRAMHESEMSAAVLKIAEELDEMIYEKEMAKSIVIIWRATQHDPFIHTDDLGLTHGYGTYENAKKEAEKLMKVEADSHRYFDYRIFELVKERRVKTLDRQQLIDYRDKLLRRAEMHCDPVLANPQGQRITHESNLSKEVRTIAGELGKIICQD